MRYRKGFSLAEVMVASVIIGLASVSVFRLFAGLGRSHAELVRQDLASVLVTDIMREIKQQPYKDPAGATTLGCDTGETATDRMTYDDVDDYAAVNECPPKTRTGVAYDNTASITRQVSVIWVNTADFSQTAGADGGIKKVTVIVKTPERVLAQESFVIANTTFNVNTYYGY